jgi:hypothetical protein
VCDSIAKIAVVAPCSIAVPSPRTSHSTNACAREHAEILQVLDDRKARSDRESELRGINREADTALENQVGDEHAFGRLLNRRSGHPVKGAL